MTELEIKVILADSISNQYPDYIMGIEFPFQFGERRADLALLNEMELTSYEIKSATDRTARLSYQLDSYKSYFDYCYVVCEETNLKEVRTNTPRSIGILIVSNKEIKHIRKSNKFKNHNKESLCSTLPISFLRKNAFLKKIKSKHELCKHISSIYSIETIRKWSRLNFKERYEIASKLVKIEKGDIINKDDIFTLTKKSPTKLFRRTS
ncbi:sce7726 family protein [Vreelandella maris]|uniref:Sce7726 family protein n=1 Tax=Vreelandella maris TaxID=2729617 RepID=A0A7Y6RC97_9GAMM|nr:sce7726 family protein [Halomonas maris]NVF14299.1 sce7726 family protein [Halomonas maris]|tara:strand:- start:3371 stop:3994 length:624 start_codon:yes stop_codon:yes gene_type:complete